MLSHVSHSPYRTTVSPTWNTTTRRRSATASQPRLHASPLTFSLNSNSATSCASASSQRMTLFGGYRGLLPPPTRNRSEDVCNGTTKDSVPPVISVIASAYRTGHREAIRTHTAFPDELQRPCAVDREPGGRGGREYAVLWVKASVEDGDWGGRAYRVPRKIHQLVVRKQKQAAEDESARRVHPAVRIIAVTCELHAIGMLSTRAMLSP